MFPKQSLRIVRVTQRQLQDRFNDGDYYKRMKGGEFSLRRKSFTPRREILEQYGPDTSSWEVIYIDRDENEVARVHQYENPAGELLYVDKEGILRTDAFPDPKELTENGVTYRMKRKGTI